MDEMLKAKRDGIEARIRANDPTALDAAIALTEQYPDEPETWHTLAYAHGRARRYQAALSAITRAISLQPRQTPFLFARGRYHLFLADYDSAIEDFSQGLRLCDELKQEFYRETLHFFRAEAFVQLGRKAEARADLAHVADDCTLWTIELRSKAELVALAAE